MGIKALKVAFLFISYLLFLSTLIFAGTDVDDIIKMKNVAYKEHTKAIVIFLHKKHVDKYQVGCGEYHHDIENKSLKDLKKGK